MYQELLNMADRVAEKVFVDTGCLEQERWNTIFGLTSHEYCDTHVGYVHVSGPRFSASFNRASMAVWAAYQIG